MMVVVRDLVRARGLRLGLRNVLRAIPVLIIIRWLRFSLTTTLGCMRWLLLRIAARLAKRMRLSTLEVLMTWRNRTLFYAFRPRASDNVRATWRVRLWMLPAVVFILWFIFRIRLDSLSTVSICVCLVDLIRLVRADTVRRSGPRARLTRARVLTRVSSALYPFLSVVTWGRADCVFTWQVS